MYKALILFSVIAVASCGGERETAATIDSQPDSIHCLLPCDSIGVELGDSTYMFGDIWGRCVFPDGTTGILDQAGGTVSFFSGDGEFIRSFSPMGEGPGEFTSIDRLGCDENGNIMIASFYGRKIAWFDSDLELIDEIRFTSTRSGPVKAYPTSDLGTVAITLVFSGEDSAGTEVSLFRGAVEPEVTYRRRMALFDQFGQYQLETDIKACCDLQGRVAVADRSYDTYNIVCYSANGDTLFVIDEPFERTRRSREDIDREIAVAENNWREAVGSLAGFNYEPDENAPSIHSLGFDSRRRLWVRSGVDTSVYSIYDSTGVFQYRCYLRMPSWQIVRNWNVEFSPYGILASPADPEMYPLVYVLKEEIVPAE